MESGHHHEESRDTEHDPSANQVGDMATSATTSSGDTTSGHLSGSDPTSAPIAPRADQSEEQASRDLDERLHALQYRASGPPITPLSPQDYQMPPFLTPHRHTPRHPMPEHRPEADISSLMIYME